MNYIFQQHQSVGIDTDVLLNQQAGVQWIMKGWLVAHLSVVNKIVLNVILGWFAKKEEA